MVFTHSESHLKKVPNMFNFHTLGADGDVLTGSYKLMKHDENNFVDIKKLNKKTGDIEGAFQVTAINAYNPTDTLVVKNGKFKGKIAWK